MYNYQKSFIKMSEIEQQRLSDKLLMQQEIMRDFHKSENAWSRFEKIPLHRFCLLYQNQTDKVYSSKSKAFTIYKIDRSKLYTKQGKPNKRLKAILKQISILKKIKHQNVVKISQFYENRNTGYNFIVMEGCYTTLRQYLDKNIKTSQKTAFSFIKQIIQTLKHISSMNVESKSIRPQNILLTEDRKIRLANFTGHKFIYKIQEGLQSKQFQVKRKNRYNQSYRCPLQVNKNKSDVRNKIWSLGFILYELLFGKCPWKGSFQEIIYHKMRKQRLLLDSAHISNKTKEIIRRMLSQNNNQITYDNILEYMQPAYKLYYERKYENPNYQEQENTNKYWSNDPKNSYEKKQTQTSLNSDSYKDIYQRYESQKPFSSLNAIGVQTNTQTNPSPYSDSDLYKHLKKEGGGRSGGLLNKYDESAKKLETTSAQDIERFQYDQNGSMGRFRINVRKTPEKQKKQKSSSQQQISDKYLYVPPIQQPKSAEDLPNTNTNQPQIKKPSIPLPPRPKQQQKFSQNYKPVESLSSTVKINPTKKYDFQVNSSNQALTSTAPYGFPSNYTSTSNITPMTSQITNSYSAYTSPYSQFSSSYSGLTQSQHKPEYKYQSPSSLYEFKAQSPLPSPSSSSSPYSFIPSSPSAPSLTINKYTNNYTSSPSPSPPLNTGTYTPLSPSNNLEFKHKFQPYYQQYAKKQQPIQKQQPKLNALDIQKQSNPYQYKYQQKQSEYKSKYDQISSPTLQYQYKYEQPQFKQNYDINNYTSKPQTQIPSVPSTPRQQQSKFLTHQRSQPQLSNINTRPISQSQPKQFFQSPPYFTPYTQPSSFLNTNTVHIQNKSIFPPMNNLDFFTTPRTSSRQKLDRFNNKIQRTDSLRRFDTYDKFDRRETISYSTNNNSISNINNNRNRSNQKYEKDSKYVSESSNSNVNSNNNDNKPGFMRAYERYFGQTKQSSEKKIGFGYK